ncbi:hypothetical protein NQ315_002579 [Exocentrus adspersus]|uniref:Uncharacterized protein n=1 Tax=Exocentrus adspersus TaxID=1586481 RepID=A0AAV8VVF6_9CUCU|nr:hypothetical protein NQ315_002579 [Exocentrus adspersus]
MSYVLSFTFGHSVTGFNINTEEEEEETSHTGREQPRMKEFVSVLVDEISPSISTRQPTKVNESPDTYPYQVAIGESVPPPRTRNGENNLESQANKLEKEESSVQYQFRVFESISNSTLLVTTILRPFNVFKLIYMCYFSH